MLFERHLKVLDGCHGFGVGPGLELSPLGELPPPPDSRRNTHPQLAPPSFKVVKNVQLIF